MKRKNKNSPRQMWNIIEDKLLMEILNSPLKMTWNQIAIELHNRYPESFKSSKQCRERFRNYLDPEIKPKVWTKSEKLIFVLLHKQYGNHWGQIAKYYKGRSDISIKNRFYMCIRKILKKLKDGLNIQDLVVNPRKTIQYYYVLDLIQFQYLANLNNIDKRPGLKHETIIAELVKSRNVTETEINHCKENIVNWFRINNDHNGRGKYPIIIQPNLSDIDLDSFKAESLKQMILNQDFGGLSKYLKIEAEFLSLKDNPRIHSNLEIESIPKKGVILDCKPKKQPFLITTEIPAIQFKEEKVEASNLNKINERLPPLQYVTKVSPPNIDPVPAESLYSKVIDSFASSHPFLGGYLCLLPDQNPIKTSFMNSMQKFQIKFHTNYLRNTNV